MTRQPAPYRALASHLKQGGLIAYPTESCYGLGCDPRNHRAVQRILKLKQRSQRKGLILIAANYAQVSRYVLPVTPDQQHRLHHSVENPTTYLLPVRSTTSHALRGEHDTLAVRLTAFKPAAELCRGVRSALVSTSANRAGKKSLRTYAECRRLFGATVWVLRGEVGKRKQPSTLCDWVSGHVLR